MSYSSSISYLRLVDGPAQQIIEPTRPDDEGTLLGFVDMSSVSDEGFETILSRVQPSWVFDLRPVPYFDIGRLNRKRVFDLFSSLHASYRDVAGWLQITERNDASLNSGAVARYIAETLLTRPCQAPIVVLVDDDEIMDHALRVLPNHLKSSFAAWRACELKTISRDGAPDLILRTATGETLAVQAKLFGDRDLASAGLVAAFRIWLGDGMFAVNCEFDDGRVTQVALPLSAAALMDGHLNAAISRCTAAHHSSLSKAIDPPATSRAHRGEPMPAVTLEVESVRIREAHDGRTIVITFSQSDNERTQAVFTIEGAQRLRSQLQMLVRR
jgi:hypothetical protein